MMLSRLSGTTFFFSGRRRHTSSKRDWSSDVCSSDLEAEQPPPWSLLWPAAAPPPHPANASTAASARLGTRGRREVRATISPLRDWKSGTEPAPHPTIGIPRSPSYRDVRLG